MHAQGSSILAAVPIWSAFMREAIEGLPPVPFSKPDSFPAEKPVLRGMLPERELHSILYYVDKENPSSLSVNPLLDPQFERWEQAVLDWGRRTIPDFSSYNQASGGSSFAEPKTFSLVSVSILTPPSGSFVSNNFFLSSEIKSEKNVVSYRVFVNDREIHFSSGSFGLFYQFSLAVSDGLESQNVIRVEAQNDAGFSGSREIIVYRQNP